MAISPIPKRLKEARKAAGLSQKGLGILAGIDEFTASARMNQYEKGKHTPDFLSLEKIASALKIPAAFFYIRDDSLAYIIRTYPKLNKVQKQKVLKLFEQLDSAQ